MRGQIYKRGRYYHCRYYDNSGKLYRQSTGHTRKRQAEQFLREKEAEIASGSVPYQYDRFDFEDMKKLYKDDLIDKDIKGMRTVESNLKHLGEHFGGMQVTKIDSDKIMTYRNHRRRVDEAAKSTVQRELTTLKRMMRIAKLRKRIPEVPQFEMYKVKELTVRRKYFTQEEYIRIYNEVPQFLKPVVKFGFYTGWRRGEILNLPWDYVRLDVKPGREFIVLPKEYTKAKEQRVLPLDGELLSMLKDLHKKKNGLPWVFLNPSGTNKIHNIYPHWQNALKKAGLEGRKFHDFRRSAAVRLVDLGVHDTTVMKIVGWQDHNTLRRYKIVKLDHVKEALKLQEQELSRENQENP